MCFIRLGSQLKVSCVDLRGVEHAVEVSINSLYAAFCLLILMMYKGVMETKYERHRFA